MRIEVQENNIKSIEQHQRQYQTNTKNPPTATITNETIDPEPKLLVLMQNCYKKILRTGHGREGGRVRNVITIYYEFEIKVRYGQLWGRCVPRCS